MENFERYFASMWDESDLSKYDVIFLGYPIWYGTYANPIVTLLNNMDFPGFMRLEACTVGDRELL